MKKLKVRGGKFILEDKPDTESQICYHITYENYYTVDNPEPIKIPVNKRFEYGVCRNCENKFYNPDQKYCEMCGIAL